MPMPYASGTFFRKYQKMKKVPKVKKMLILAKIKQK